HTGRSGGIGPRSTPARSGVLLRPPRLLLAAREIEGGSRETPPSCAPPRRALVPRPHLGCALVSSRAREFASSRSASAGPRSSAPPRLRTRQLTSSSTQSNVFVTAFFHNRYVRSRSASSICGSQRLSSAQLSMTSCSPDQ